MPVPSITSITQYHETTETAMAIWSSITLYASWSFKNDVKTLPADPPSVANKWTVDDSGGANFTSIQTAINALSNVNSGDIAVAAENTHLDDGNN